MATLRIVVKKGEAKTLKFTYTEGGVAKDMTGATFIFVVKETKDDDSYELQKLDALFNKAEISTGIVKVTLTKTDLALDPKKYVAEIRAYFSDSGIDLSKDIIFVVESPVYHG